MKKAFQFKAVAFMAIALFVSTIACAQTAMPMAKKTPPSPLDSASGMVGKAMVSIKYSAPSLRGRKILGVIEPYGKPWRAGANAATTFTTDKDLKIDGKTLPAGKYTVFMTPGETEWKVMFNSALGEWGIKKDASDSRGYAANDDPAKDVLVLTVKPEKFGPTEQLKYEVTKKGFDLIWEDVKIFVAAK